MIKNYLIALCDLLDINMPSVSYDTSKGAVKKSRWNRATLYRVLKK